MRKILRGKCIFFRLFVNRFSGGGCAPGASLYHRLEKLSLFCRPFFRLSAKLRDIAKVKEKFFDSLLEKNRILASLHENNNWFLACLDIFADFFSSDLRAYAMKTFCSEYLCDRLDNIFFHLISDEYDCISGRSSDHFCKICMHLSRLRAELTHISEEKNLLIGIREILEVFDTSDDR